MFGNRQPGRLKSAEAAMSPWLRAFFMTGAKPERSSPEWLEYVTLAFFSGDALGRAWTRHGAALTAECVAASPGRRPSYWWIAEFEDDFDDFPPKAETQARYRARLEAHERESTAATLRRRGLRLPGELERIPNEAFEPEGAA
jgi:hypothetical protein